MPPIGPDAPEPGAAASGAAGACAWPDPGLPVDANDAQAAPAIARPDVLIVTGGREAARLLRAPGIDLTRRLPALASATYRRFLAAAFVGAVGSWMQATAQGWLVLDLTDSPAALGLVSAVGMFPVLAFSIFAGVLADRVDRRRLLVAAQVCAAAVALVLAVLTTVGIVTYWQIVALAFLAGTATAIQTPAYQAIVATLVDRAALGSAVALNAAQFNLSRIVGPSLAGAAIAIGGLQLAFWGNAAALLLVAVVMATLRIASQPTLVRLEASLWANLLDGLRFVRADSLILALVALSGVPALFALSYLALLPIYARDVLGIGAPGLGLLAGSVGAGALAGALALAVLRPSGGSGRSLLLGLALASLALVVFAVSRVVAVSVVALALLGACQVLYYATTNTLLQVLAPARLRGRVISLYILASWGLIPIGNVLAGLVAEHWGPTIALAGGGIATLGVVVAVAWGTPAIRRLNAASAADRRHDQRAG